MKVPRRFEDIDEEPLIMEEESKSLNLSREIDAGRILETGKFEALSQDRLLTEK